MHKSITLFAATCLLTVIASSIPASAELAAGIIRTIDVENATITLDSDVEYALAEDFDLNQLDIGQQVELEFENDEDGNFITNLVAIE